MSPLRPLLASILLAALAMGGIVLPVAHDVAHGGEQAELAETLAATHGDHHHHQLEDDHGTEAQPYCPEATDVDLVCAFCSTQASAMLASSAMGLKASDRQLEGATTERRAGTERTTQSARGPPIA